MKGARPSDDPKSAVACFQFVAYGKHFSPVTAGFVTSCGPTKLVERGTRGTSCHVYKRASSTMLNGPSVARRT